MIKYGTCILYSTGIQYYLRVLNNKDTIVFMHLLLSWIKMELKDYILVFVLWHISIVISRTWMVKKNRIIKIQSAHPYFLQIRNFCGLVNNFVYKQLTGSDAGSKLPINGPRLNCSEHKIHKNTIRKTRTCQSNSIK